MGAMAAEVEAIGWPPRVSGEWTVDLLELTPDDGQRYEILDGTLVVTPAPRPRHQRAALRLAMRLEAVCPPEFETFIGPLDWQPDGRTSLEPDVLIVRRDRIGERVISDTPTVVIEVASPGTARFDRTVKLSRYAEGGIEQYWIVDPAVPSIEVYDLVDGAYRLVAQATGDEIASVSAPIAVELAPRDLT